MPDEPKGPRYRVIRLPEPTNPAAKKDEAGRKGYETYLKLKKLPPERFAQLPKSVQRDFKKIDEADSKWRRWDQTDQWHKLSKEKQAKLIEESRQRRLAGLARGRAIKAKNDAIRRAERERERRNRVVKPRGRPPRKEPAPLDPSEELRSLPNWVLRTPARANSARGDFLSGNPDYRGPSDPGRSRYSDTRAWLILSKKLNLEPHQHRLIGIMEYWLKYMLEKVLADMRKNSPGSIADHWHYRVQRDDLPDGQKTLRYYVWNQHVAFRYMLAGTASRRVITVDDWKGGMDDKRPYPIVPIPGLNKNPLPRNAREQIIRDAERGVAYVIGRRSGSGFTREQVGQGPGALPMLKFSGKWIDRGGGAFMATRMRAAGFQETTKTVETEDGKKFTVTSRATNKRGEVYVPYVREHPGIEPHAQLLQAWRAWAAGGAFRRHHGEISSKVAQALTKSIRQGLVEGQSAEATITVPLAKHARIS